MTIGRKLDDFADPNFKPQISELCRSFLGESEQEGILRLGGPDGTVWDVEYSAKGNVLPVRHLLVLHHKTTSAQTAGGQVSSMKKCEAHTSTSIAIGSWHRRANRVLEDETDSGEIPSWAQDYGLFLLDANERIVRWYSGAARICGHQKRRGSRQTRVFFLPRWRGLQRAATGA